MPPAWSRRTPRQRGASGDSAALRGRGLEFLPGRDPDFEVLGGLIHRTERLPSAGWQPLCLTGLPILPHDAMQVSNEIPFRSTINILLNFPPFLSLMPKKLKKTSIEAHERPKWGNNGM
jgi:hypothetical protein